MSKRYWELLIANEDQTWQTDHFEIPEGLEEKHVNTWFFDDQDYATQYPDAIMVAVFHVLTPSECATLADLLEGESDQAWLAN